MHTDYFLGIVCLNTLFLELLILYYEFKLDMEIIIYLFI